VSHWIEVGKGRWAAQTLAFALIYGVTARLGWLFATHQTGISPFWPPAGIAIAALLLGGVSLWPGVFLGALVADLSLGVHWRLASSGAVANSLEAVAAAWMLSRWPGFQPSLKRLRDVTAFISTGALAALIGTGVGVAGMMLFSRPTIVVHPGRVAPIWWLGDAMGILVFGPPILAWAHWRRPRPIPIGDVIEAAALAAALALTTMATFLPSVHQISATHSAIEYLPFPLVIWAAMRFGMRGASTAALVLSFFALWHFSVSPVERQALGADRALLLVQTSIAVIVLTALIIAAVMMERDAVARALAASEIRYRTLYNNTPVMLHSIDPDGRLVSVSDHWLREMGYRRDEVIGKRSIDFLTEESRARATNVVLPEFFATGRVLDVEYQFIRRDGGLMDVNVSAVAERDADGTIIKSMAVLIDVTARKRAEAERQQIEVTLQQAKKLESLGLLAGGIAHDFNNLLTSILGSANLARHQRSEQALAQHLEQIEQSAERAADLCRQMLAYAGQGRFQVLPHDISATIEETLAQMAASIGPRVTLDLSLGRRLPAVEGDTTQLRQVITNLVLNASESIGEAAGTIRVRTGAMFAGPAYLASSHLSPDLPSGTYVFLEVADTGKGMTPDIQSRIFDPFFTTKFTGRGLGLAAVLGIVRSHGGAIWVDSKPGQGATFRVLLPATQSTADEASAPRAAASPKWNSAGLALVIDDEPSVRAVTKRMLEACGLSVRTASDGDEGLALFREFQADIAVVLLDLTMPGIAGDEVFSEIRRVDANVPIVLMTGFTEQEATTRFGGSNLAGLLQKPFRIEAVRDLLQQLFTVDRLKPDAGT
jgi:two-component system cell cycle sensor histidine kinase/response regulator CckA